jgi:class 3 adenylate cyclase
MATYLDSSDPSISASQRDPSRARVKVRALVICDLVDSTALVDTLGDKPAAEIIRKHDRLARDLFHRFNGQEIDKADGFLVLFAQPADALRFALGYQRDLQMLARDLAQPLLARVGIHYGEIVLYENTRDDIAQGAKPIEAEGIAKPIAARLMSVALPQQILLTRGAYELAKRAFDSAPVDPALQWRQHGRYQIKGLTDPLDIFEVGDGALAPLRPPLGSDKVQRVDGGLRRVSPWLIAAAVLASIAVLWILNQ